MSLGKLSFLASLRVLHVLEAAGVRSTTNRRRRESVIKAWTGGLCRQVSGAPQTAAAAEPVGAITHIAVDVSPPSACLVGPSFGVLGRRSEVRTNCWGVGRPLASHGDSESPQTRRYIPRPREGEVKGRKFKSASERGSGEVAKKVNFQVWERLMKGKLENEGKSGRSYEVRSVKKKKEKNIY